MGVMGVAMILAPAIGPTLSGYIVQNYHWNVMFYGMFFIGLVAVLVGYIWFRLYQHTEIQKRIFQVLFSVLSDSVHCFTDSVKQVTMDGVLIQ